MSKWGKTKTFLLSQRIPQTDRETYFVILKIPSDENPYHYEIQSTIFQQQSVAQTLPACQAFGNYTVRVTCWLYMTTVELIILFFFSWIFYSKLSKAFY